VRFVVVDAIVFPPDRRKHERDKFCADCAMLPTPSQEA
jgi:hypothetical protein